MATRIKGYLSNIHTFYTFQTFDHIAFGYIQGLRRALPTITVTKSIETFLEDFGLCEDVYCFDSAKQAYYRILKALRDKEMGAIDETEE